MPVVALVGYTNAGKSTLLNQLTDAEVLCEDQLFATLDPTTRRITLPSGMQVCCFSQSPTISGYRLADLGDCRHEQAPKLEDVRSGLSHSMEQYLCTTVGQEPELCCLHLQHALWHALWCSINAAPICWAIM